MGELFEGTHQEIERGPGWDFPMADFWPREQPKLHSRPEGSLPPLSLPLLPVSQVDSTTRSASGMPTSKIYHNTTHCHQERHGAVQSCIWFH